jgi:hypothetical protein
VRPLAQWPLALTGSHWLQLSIVLGGIAVASARPLRSRASAHFHGFGALC